MMMLGYADRRRLSDVVANKIREYVIQNDLRPGDRMPTELELAERWGVSRVSIREATKALGLLGFLEAVPRRGTTVGQVDLRRVVQFLELHPALRDAGALQLIESRLVVELGMLPHLMEVMRRDPYVYYELKQFLRTFEGVDDLERWINLDREFHGRMMDASGLAPLFLFHELVGVFFARILEQARDPEVEELLRSQLPEKAASHQRIINFLRDGRIDAAREELRAHVTSYREILEPES